MSERDLQSEYVSLVKTILMREIGDSATQEQFDAAFMPLIDPLCGVLGHMVEVMRMQILMAQWRAAESIVLSSSEAMRLMGTPEFFPLASYADRELTPLLGEIGYDRAGNRRIVVVLQSEAV